MILYVVWVFCVLYGTVFCTIIWYVLPFLRINNIDNNDSDKYAALLDNFIHRKQTIEHNTNQIKLNNN